MHSGTNLASARHRLTNQNSSFRRVGKPSRFSEVPRIVRLSTSRTLGRVARATESERAKGWVVQDSVQAAGQLPGQVRGAACASHQPATFPSLTSAIIETVLNASNCQPSLCGLMGLSHCS